MLHADWRIFPNPVHIIQFETAAVLSIFLCTITGRRKVIKLKLKVKNKLTKRHKTMYRYRGVGYTLQLTAVFESNSEQICLESTTENRQTVCFSD